MTICKKAELEFCERMWSTDQNVYKERLQSIGFCNLDRVLDLGAGCGQWSLALSELNNYVDSVEPSEVKIEFFTRRIKNKKNIFIYKRKAEKFDFKNQYYDGIFCYGAIHYMPINILKKLYLSLKKGGVVYISAINLEFYIYTIIHGHNDSINFDSRKNAIEVIKNAIMNSYWPDKKRYPTIYLSNYLVDVMKKVGFSIIEVNNEGKINITGRNIKSFYPEDRFGKMSVYEILAAKR